MTERTNDIGGLRIDFNQQLSDASGAHYPAEVNAGNDRDMVQGDRFNFRFALSF